MHGAKQLMGKDSVQEYCAQLEKAILLPCYSIFDRQSVENMYEYIIRQLSEEESC